MVNSKDMYYGYTYVDLLIHCNDLSKLKRMHGGGKENTSTVTQSINTDMNADINT